MSTFFVLLDEFDNCLSFIKLVIDVAEMALVDDNPIKRYLNWEKIILFFLKFILYFVISAFKNLTISRYCINVKSLV